MNVKYTQLKCNIFFAVEEMVAVGKELVSHNGGDLADCRFDI